MIKYRSSPENPCCQETQTLLEIRDLSLKFHSQYAFRNINLKIPKKCITGIVGPSGSGKSSLLQTLSRIIELDDTANVTGEILYKSEDILKNQAPLRTWRKKVGMVFQNPSPFPFSIEKNLLIPLIEHKIQKPRERMEELLKKVGLWEEVKYRLKESALSLSGGQQQRLCIARALSIDPEILLMDEPCSALDPIASRVLEDLILELRNPYTLVIVTHNLAQAARLADFVAVLWNPSGNGGELLEFNSTYSVFETPQNKLTSDYVRGLQG